MFILKLTDEQKQEIVKQLDNISKNCPDENKKAQCENFKNNLDKFDDNGWFGLAMILGMYGDLGNPNK